MGTSAPESESDSELYELTKVLTEPTFFVSEGGLVSAANPPAGRLLDLNHRELGGKRLHDLTTDPPEKVDRYVRACLRSGSPIPGSLSFKASDGRTVDCRCDGATAKLGGKEPVVLLRCVPKGSTSNTFLALNEEIQVLRNEHRRIGRERERLVGILESINDAFFAVDRDWRFTYVNRKAEEVWGRSREGLLGKRIWEEFPQASGSESYRHIKRAMEERITTEFEAVSPVLGTWVSGRAYPSGDGLSVYFQDITERKRAEKAMAEAREAERRRIARDLHDGVLQDLSYVAATMEITKLQAQGTSLEEELQEEVDAIRSAAQALRAAVHDLRLADELDQPFPRLLESLVERNREMARTQQIGLEVKEGFPTTPLGQAGTELLRVLQEALTNVRRHSGATSVLVRLGEEGGDLVAEVADDGRGFGPGTAPGIGLRSMRERAATLGGDLEVESEPEKGTRVRVRIPWPRS